MKLALLTGASGAGKSTLSRRVRESAGDSAITIVALDDVLKSAVHRAFPFYCLPNVTDPAIWQAVASVTRYNAGGSQQVVAIDLPTPFRLAIEEQVAAANADIVGDLSASSTGRLRGLPRLLIEGAAIADRVVRDAVIAAMRQTCESVEVQVFELTIEPHRLARQRQRRGVAGVDDGHDDVDSADADLRGFSAWIQSGQDDLVASRQIGTTNELFQQIESFLRG